MRNINKKGFTLIELLAVIVIMGILMAIAIPSISLVITNSRKDIFINSALTFINEAEKISGLKINNVGIDSLINLSTPVKSEVMLNALNLRGIMVSSKSTCSSREHGTNRALSAIGVDEDYAIRVSFDYSNTREEIDYFMECIKEAIKEYGA